MMATEKRARVEFHKEQCLAFVQKLWDADTLGMFRHPIDPAEVPGYHKIITHPTDLSTIKSKIEQADYGSDGGVEEDVALMIDNALEFNENGSEWHKHAQHFRKIYRSLAREAGMILDDDHAFIPAKRAKDDETTLRKAEQRGDEQLDDVLEGLEKDKTIPLEELRARYAHDQNQSSPNKSNSTGGGRDSSRSSESSDDECSSASSSEGHSSDGEDDASSSSSTSS